jgi:hypothetical protein
MTMKVLMEVNQRKREKKDVQNEKRRNDAKP